MTAISTDYVKGYTTGQVTILQGLQQRLREDPDIRTVVGVAEVINNLLEDKMLERDKAYDIK